MNLIVGLMGMVENEKKEIRRGKYSGFHICRRSEERRKEKKRLKREIREEIDEEGR